VNLPRPHALLVSVYPLAFGVFKFMVLYVQILVITKLLAPVKTGLEPDFVILVILILLEKIVIYLANVLMGIVLLESMELEAVILVTLSILVSIVMNHVIV